MRFCAAFEDTGQGNWSAQRKHSEAQIIEALKQVEALPKCGRGKPAVRGFKAYDVMYGCKAKYGGLDVSEAQEIKQLRGPSHLSVTRYALF